MTPFPQTPEYLQAARRIIWFETPEQALNDPLKLMAYALKHSTDEDMALLLQHVGQEGLVEALDKASPGIIDPRSWAYWNAKAGRYPAPPMPTWQFGPNTEAEKHERHRSAMDGLYATERVQGLTERPPPSKAALKQRAVKVYDDEFGASCSDDTHQQAINNPQLRGR